jgi:hypothetical protein
LLGHRLNKFHLFVLPDDFCHSVLWKNIFSQHYIFYVTLKVKQLLKNNTNNNNLSLLDSIKLSKLFEKFIST